MVGRRYLGILIGNYWSDKCKIPAKRMKIYRFLKYKSIIMKTPKLIYLIFVFSIFASRSVIGQTIEMSMIPDNVSTFKLDHSQLLISDLDLKIFSGNYNLNVKQVINEKVNLLAGIPVLHFRVDNSRNKTGIGNLFLGIQFKKSKTDKIRSAVNVGVYLPTASDPISSRDRVLFGGQTEYGIRTNLFEFPKYPDKTITAQIGYNSFRSLSNKLRIGFELGSNIVVSKRYSKTETDIFARYGVSLLYPKDKGFNAQVELLGSAILTQDGSFGLNTTHTYAMSLGYNWNRVGIGVYYRNYFDDLNIDLKGVFGTQLFLFTQNSQDRKILFPKSGI